MAHVSFGVGAEAAARVLAGCSRGPASSLAEQLVDVRTKVIPFIEPREAAALEALCVAVEADDGSGESMRALAGESRRYSFLL
jgi:hypothetical protein